MSDRLIKFLFHAAPVRGGLVRVDGAWRQMVELHDFPPVVTRLLGEMVAAAALLATNIKFNGALIMQVHGDGPVKLLVVECQPDLALRATAKLGEESVDEQASLQQLINRGGRGRFAITLDPRDPRPGQQPYQGIVPLDGHTMAGILETYMRQSEQLETRLVLAADEHASAGLLLQRLPEDGGTSVKTDADAWDRATSLGATLSGGELLEFEPDTLLLRLFGQERIQPQASYTPRFACTCSRDRIGRMLISLGREEVDSIIDEMRVVTVTCDFCSRSYSFDAVDVAQLFASGNTETTAHATRH